MNMSPEPLPPIIDLLPPLALAEFGSIKLGEHESYLLS
jgi:hypothetical protein